MEQRVIEINGVEFIDIPEARYPGNHSYYKVMDKIAAREPGWDELSTLRALILNDLFFIIYFVMKMRQANHPFVIDRCREVQEAEDKDTINNTLFLWSREHYKSTIITTARTVQRLLRNPERRFGIFSYAKDPAKKLLRPIKNLFESSQILKDCFRDVLYQNPEGESPKWSEGDGIVVRREGFYKESSVEAHGLLEGMPTGSHFTDLVYDDIETEDLVNTPEMMEKTKRAYEASKFLGSEGSCQVVSGTTYHWNGPLQYIKQKTYSDGKKMFQVSFQPCCENGDPNGKSVLLSEEKIREWKTDSRSFNSQGLLNPTPITDIKLNPELLKIIRTKFLPEKLYKFMVVDSAGDKGKRADGRTPDAWAFGVIGVEPYLDNLGVSNIYILDLEIGVMSEPVALKKIVDMYMRHGRIMKLGVEKVALSTAETHISNALRMRGRLVTIDNEMLQVLSPAGRSKQKRIESSLQWPLENGKIHVLETLDNDSLERLRLEMEKFPYWNDDGLDMMAYLYDLINGYNFVGHPVDKPKQEKPKDAWEEAFAEAERNENSKNNSWQGV